jgi:parallel beta-helix repeat protein
MMNSMQNNWAGQRRSLTIGGATPALLAWLRRLAVLILVALTFTATSAHAAAVTVVPRDFPTIQAAVDAAVPGATIKVQPGTYTEQIVIAKDVTLKGDSLGNTIIQAPAALTPYAVVAATQAPIVAVVRITASAHVTLSGLTVTGPIPCGVGASGIHVANDATLQLKNAHITRIQPEQTCAGFFAGFGIGVGLPPTIEIDGQRGSSGHAIITDVTVDRYQDVGIEVVAPPGGAPSTATIADNSISGGASPFGPVAQTGILLRGAISAQVKENTVRGNACTLPVCGRDPISQVQSIGILALAAAKIVENHVSTNDVGIYQLLSPNCCSIRENTIENNRFFGIIIQDGDGATEQNAIKGGEVGIGVVADTQDTVGILRGDRIRQASVAPVKEIACCGFTATAIVK